MTSKALKEMVGGNLRIDLSPDGFVVTNGAGTANYDQWGSRTTVNGIPEYFPITITVTGWDKLAATVVDKTDDSSANAANIQTEAERLKKMVSEIVAELIKKELQPGGLLSRK